MKYSTKYFNENRIVISENNYSQAYDLDGHRIGISQCDRSRYVSVFVDGETVATRAKRSNAIYLALEYLEKITFKYTLQMFIEDYEGFNWNDGEIVVLNRETGKSYICEIVNGKLHHVHHDMSNELEAEVLNWTHTKQTMLITV